MDWECPTFHGWYKCLCYWLSASYYFKCPWLKWRQKSCLSFFNSHYLRDSRSWAMNVFIFFWTKYLLKKLRKELKFKELQKLSRTVFPFWKTISVLFWDLWLSFFSSTVKFFFFKSLLLKKPHYFYFQRHIPVLKDIARSLIMKNT